MGRFYNSDSQWQAVAILAISGDIFVMTGVGRLLASGRGGDILQCTRQPPPQGRIQPQMSVLPRYRNLGLCKLTWVSLCDVELRKKKVTERYLP